MQNNPRSIPDTSIRGQAHSRPAPRSQPPIPAFEGRHSRAGLERPYRGAGEALAIQYRPLVRLIARHVKRRMPRADFEDLEQAGMVGLIEAAARFRGEANASLTTFVEYRIRGAMIDSLRKDDWAPRSVAKGGREIVQACQAIEAAEQRPARETEIAERLGLSLAAYRQLLADHSAHHVFSIDEAPNAMNAESHSPRPDDEAAEARLDSDLGKAIAALPERERMIIEMGLNGMTLIEAGKVLGVTESRACQLRAQAVARLRAKLGDWL